MYSVFVVPELQGEPEDISREKARLASIKVLNKDWWFNSTIPKDSFFFHSLLAFVFLIRALIQALRRPMGLLKDLEQFILIYGLWIIIKATTQIIIVN